MTVVQQLGARWSAFWLDHSSALNLAVARILLAVQALWVLLSRDYAAISGLPDVFWSTVATSTTLRYLLFPGQPALELVLQWMTVGALVAVVLGVHVRIAAFLSALLLYHLAPLEGIIWMTSPYVRGLTLPVLGLMILSLSRCGDRFVLWPKPNVAVRGSPPFDYSWQLRLVQLMVCQVYLFSGWSKIERVGVGWARGENIERWILYLAQDPDFAVFRSLGLWITERPVLTLGIGVGTLAFELIFILVMFSPRSRRVLVPMALLFHVGIVFAMNLTFVSALLLLIFVNWDWVFERWRVRSSGGAGSRSDPITA